MIQKIHTKVFRNNRTPANTLGKRSRMEMGYTTRTGVKENKRVTDDKTDINMS